MTGETAAVTIRPAGRSDMAAVAIMAGEFHAFLAAMDHSDPAFDVARTERTLCRFGFGKKPLFSALIAEGSGAPVGYAIYSIGFWADSFQGVVFLTDLFVREAFRSRGIGRRLMGRLAAIGREQGCEIVLWTVWDRNQAAECFYERLGTTPMPDKKLMKWPISPREGLSG